MPNTYAQVTVRLRSDELAELDAAAQAAGMSRYQAMRRAVLDWVRGAAKAAPDAKPVRRRAPTS